MCWEQEFWKELSEEQTTLLKQFRGLMSDVSNPSFDDYFFWRWLKSRKCNLEKAENALRAHLRARRNIGTDTILTNYELPEVYKNYIPTYFAGFDSDGDAIIMYKTGSFDIKGLLNSLTAINQVKCYTHHVEELLHFMREESVKKKKRSRRLSAVHDLKGIALSLFLDPKVLKRVLDLTLMYETNYPELLKKAYILNAPSYFALWYNVAKKVMDPAIISKIEVYTEGYERMPEVFDPDIIPAVFGGSLTDPDGNPNCYSIFKPSYKVPESMYIEDMRPPLVKDPLSKKVTVRERDHYIHSVCIKQKQSLLHWRFQTLDQDIGFAVIYVPSDEKLSSIKSSKDGLFYTSKTKKQLDDGFEVLRPLQRIPNDFCEDIDQIVCENVGTYALYFDNTFSWIRSKELYFKIEVIPPTNKSEDCYQDSPTCELTT